LKNIVVAFIFLSILKEGKDKINFCKIKII